MLQLTLTRHRSTPERYARLIKFHRDGDTVHPTGINRGCIKAVPWALLRSDTEPKVDREFAEAWCAHIDAQAVNSIEESPCITRELLIKAGLLMPADAAKWKRSLKAVASSVPA